jgi:gas vesicle protein
VPSWGRPPGAKGSKRRRRWEQEQQARWEQEQELSHGARIEELDSDDTDTQGVGLSFDQKRIVYDPLHFTGTGLPSQPRVRKGYKYDTDSYDSESEESGDDNNAMQVALRDKEEALVQSALARIRRAQEKGKSQVKLNPEELEALERRRQRMQALGTKGKQGSGSGSGSERKRRSERLISVPIADAPGRTKGKSRRGEDFDTRPSGSPAPPGILVGGADGVYAPLGYYPPQSSSSRNSPTRPRSSMSQQLAYQHGQPRHYSDGTRPTSSSSNGSRRPLPDEEDWVPNSRRSSESSQHHGQDPFDYQIDNGHPPPIPQQYVQTRRIVSGSPEIMYSTLRRNPPSYSSSSREPPAESSSRRKSSQRNSPESISSSSDEEEDESDDLNNGVQVFVEERDAPKERTVPRKPVGGRKRGKR